MRGRGRLAIAALQCRSLAGAWATTTDVADRAGAGAAHEGRECYSRRNGPAMTIPPVAPSRQVVRRTLMVARQRINDILVLFASYGCRKKARTRGSKSSQPEFC